MVRVLTGPAKTLGESIPVEELRAGGWDWDEEQDDWLEPDLLRGINKLLETLATIGTDAPVRKGQVMTYFYKILHRRRGEEINAWVVRFGDARAQLNEEEVGLPQGTAGWWLIDKSGLTEAQKSMLATATMGSYDLSVVVPAMIRIFPQLHMHEKKFVPTQSTDKKKFLKQKVHRRMKEANVTEYDDALDDMSEDGLEALAAQLDEEEHEDLEDQDAQAAEVPLRRTTWRQLSRTRSTRS